MTSFRNCWWELRHVFTPARRATRHALPTHPPIGRPLRRFRRAAAATPAASGSTLVCVRLAALAAPLAFGPAALPAPVALGPVLPFVGGFGPILAGGAGAPGSLGDADYLAVTPAGLTAAGSGPAAPALTTIPEPASVAALLLALTLTLIARRPAR